jgi:hypothetical protein
MPNVLETSKALSRMISISSVVFWIIILIGFQTAKVANIWINPYCSIFCMS